MKVKISELWEQFKECKKNSKQTFISIPWNPYFNIWGEWFSSY